MIPASAITDRPFAAELSPLGFSPNRTGGHMARSMMLQEITELCRTTPVDMVLQDYQRMIVEDNLLGKPTLSSRQKTHRHLVELYGLEPSLPLFRIFRKLADEDPLSIPLMGMVCTFCRDLQLRHSFTLIECLRSGEVLSRDRMEQHFELAFPGVFSDAMKKSLAQNVNTTWTASGHLEGRAVKRRTLPRARLCASTYAMLAGWLAGLRGNILLESVFSRLVALESDQIVRHLADASARGWLRFRHAGGVTEIDFTPIFTEHELSLIHVPH
jgi:hypothetical protein